MDKKVIDIRFPKEREKEEVELRPQLRPKKTEFRGQPGKAEIGPPPKPFKKGAALLLIFLLIFIIIFCYFTLSRAEIEIIPESEFLTFEKELTIDENLGKADFSIGAIPGEIFKKEKTFTESFPSTGEILKEGKAEGVIKVYNEYSTSPQILIATTRFVSDGGKLFRTPNKVTIPGGHYEGEKFIPGEIEIIVVADQPGPEYNIGPSTFSIPGFAGTPRYTKFYARSFQPMEGGFLKEVSQVTEEDLEEAERVLIEKAKEECKASLKKELGAEEFSSEFYFVEDSIRTEALESFALAKIGDEKEDFNFQVKAESKTLIFREEDLKNFAKEIILPEIPPGKKLHEESLEINFTPKTVNLISGKIILSVEGSAKIYSDIDIFALKNNLKGKTAIEAKIFLENQPEIVRTKIELWPFWVKEIPEKEKKIELRLNLSEAI